MILPRLLGMRFFQSANLLGVIPTLYYRAHGLNYVQILSFEIVLSLTMALTTVPLGVWADRRGRAAALKGGSLLFLLAALAFLAARVYWQFVVCDALYGLGFAWQSEADTALLVPGGAAWFARDQAVAAAAGLSSSLVAGWLLETNGMHVLVVLNVVTALLASAVTLTLPADARRAPVPVPAPARQVTRAVGAIRGAPWVVAWTLAGTVAFRLVGINLMFWDLPLWVQHGWHGLWLGLGVATLSAAGWASLLSPAARRRLGPRTVLTLTQVAMGILVAALPLLGSPWGLTLAMAAALACQSWQRPIADAAITAAIPEPLRVSVLSMLDLPALAVTIVAEVGVGLLGDAHLAWALFASGGLLAATTPLWWVRGPTGHVGPEAPVARSA